MNICNSVKLIDFHYPNMLNSLKCKLLPDYEGWADSNKKLVEIFYFYFERVRREVVLFFTEKQGCLNKTCVMLLPKYILARLYTHWEKWHTQNTHTHLHTERTCALEKLMTYPLLCPYFHWLRGRHRMARKN